MFVCVHIEHVCSTGAERVSSESVAAGTIHDQLTDRFGKPEDSANGRLAGHLESIGGVARRQVAGRDRPRRRERAVLAWPCAVGMQPVPVSGAGPML